MTRRLAAVHEVTLFLASALVHGINTAALEIYQHIFSG
jgi:hypothetical protein